MIIVSIIIFNIRKLMPKPKIKIMVASTIYHFKSEIEQICSVLDGYGYKVWNSHLGTIPQHPGKSNLENCVSAAESCDVFLGIVRPFYGTGIVGDRSITHEEFRKAYADPKPRWAMVHHDVMVSRGLLKPYMFKRNGVRTKFKLKKNPVLDDLRVIDLYNDATLGSVPLRDRKGHWVQEFFSMPEVLIYLANQFEDVDRIRQICKEMKNP
jgi:hypothetical protein